jgi:ATF/CREB family transcription factor
LKCRQRKKQWLQNLQSKVEAYSAENDNLQGQLQQLRDEVVNLKTMLLAHKDCPISHQQGIAGHGMQSILQQGYNPHNPDAQMNPYGMAMGQQVQQQAAMMAAGGPGMQGRRFS